MGFAVVIAFLALFMLGFPVVYAILLPSIAYVIIEGLPLGLLTQRVTYALDSFPLVAVPLFIFVGNLMNLSGITDRIFRFAYTLVGRIPGGLAQVNVFGSLIFSGMSGAALADIGGLGRIEIDAMKKRGFDPSFAGAVTAASATLGPIFPPSIPLIVYGSVTSVSIVQLLVAGIMPALVCTVLLMLTVLIVAIRHKHPRAERWSTPGEVLRDFLPALPAIVAPVLMIAGMTLGAFTPTEAAAITAVYVILISAVDLSRADARASVELGDADGAQLERDPDHRGGGGAVRLDPGGGAGAADLRGGAARACRRDPLMLLIIANLIFFVAGMFLDSTTATLLLVPIIAPPLVAGRRRSGAARHRHHLQPDDRPADAADGPVAVPGLRHRQGVDPAAAQGAAPLLHPAADHARDPDLREGFHAVAAAHDRSMNLRRILQHAYRHRFRPRRLPPEGDDHRPYPVARPRGPRRRLLRSEPGRLSGHRADGHVVDRRRARRIAD